MKAKGSRWRQEQKQKKDKKHKRAIGWWLAAAGLLLVAGLVVKTFQIVVESRWDGESRLNFVLIGDQVTLASFDPPEEELVLVSLPQGTMLEVVHGYGKYRVEAVERLEELEGRKGLLAETLQENFGIPVEGMVNSELKIVNSKNDLAKELGEQILSKGRTNFSKWDLVRLWWQVKKLRFDQVKSLDLSKISVLSSQTLPDQTKVWEIDQTRLDSYLAKFFLDSKMREENLEIEVLNGTSHLGLAERGARMITNMGGMVVRAGNSDVKSQKSKVKSQKSKKNSYTVRKIMRIFNCEWEEKKEEGTAEITLILGEDYWQKLNQK